MSRTIPVFRNGAWMDYPLPVSINPLWSQAHLFQAASFYATARSQGYNPSDSSVYAEAYINKSLYPGMEYNRSLEQTLQRIMTRAETT